MGEEENASLVSVEKMKENMARSYHWTSATKRYIIVQGNLPLYVAIFWNVLCD